MTTTGRDLVEALAESAESAPPQHDMFTRVYWDANRAGKNAALRDVEQQAWRLTPEAYVLARIDALQQLSVRQHLEIEMLYGAVGALRAEVETLKAPKPKRVSTRKAQVIGEPNGE